MRRWSPILVLVAACDVPKPEIELYLSTGPAQECPAASCDEISLTCDSYLSIRVIDPEHPTTAFISQCEQITPNNRRDLCALSRISLEPIELPYRDFEVQVAVFPAEMITFDEATGAPRCPTGTTYDATDGFPIGTSSDPLPAIGGRAYYRTGDETIAVTLGCTDLAKLANPTCEGIAAVHARATVDDFDTHVSVDATEANRLSVSVGEPVDADPDVVLNPGNVATLERTTANPPAWAGDIEQLFNEHACVAVLDAEAQSTYTVSCVKADLLDDEVDLLGSRLTKTSLDGILGALGLTSVPVQGLTIGVVLDRGQPVGGLVVSAPGATVEYLSSNRTSVGGSSTTPGARGGVFVSRDAPFGTVFTTSRLAATASGIGGRIANKVTIVVLDVGTEIQPN